MTYGSKWRISIGFLVFFAIWPLGQFLLTQWFGVNAWKLMGWEMYSPPQPVPKVRTLEIRGGTPTAVETETLPMEIRRELVWYEIYRRGLGRLWRPKGVARKMLEADGTLEGVSFLVPHEHLNRKTAVLEVRSQAYIYMREELMAGEVEASPVAGGRARPPGG